jgi:hypothetical protein
LKKLKGCWDFYHGTSVGAGSSKAFHHNKKATYLKDVGTYFDPKIFPI